MAEYATKEKQDGQVAAYALASDELMRREAVKHPHGSNLTTLKALDAKGLVAWKYKDGKPDGFDGLTEAGKIMCELLKLAGLTIENTVTPASYRERFAA